MRNKWKRPARAAQTVRLLLECGADPGLQETVLRHTALELAQCATKGSDPDLCDVLKGDEFRIDPDTLFAMIPDVGLSPEEIARAKAHMSQFDMAALHRENADRAAHDGDFPETIRLLTNASAGSAQSTNGNP